MCSKGQRYGTILSFSLLFVVLFSILLDGSTNLFYALEAASGSSLSINFDSPVGILAAICFIFNYALMYLNYALPYGFTTFALVTIICILIDIIRYRKLSLLMVLTMVSMVLVMVYGLTNQWMVLVISMLIGLILFDQTYFLNKTYDLPYAFKGLLSDYIALFVGYHVQDHAKMDICHYHTIKSHHWMVSPVAVTVINCLLYLVNIITLGLSYGLTIHIKAKMMISSLSIQNQHLIYQGKWVVWLIKGIKWWIFTGFTLGFYWLCGCVQLDKIDTLTSQIHFESDDSNASFFDGTMFDYSLIHLFGMVLTILSFGLLYPLYQTISNRYLINHMVIDGFRLVDGSSLKSYIFHWIWCYPLLIITLGLFHGYDQLGQWIKANDKIGFDDDPYLYQANESYVSASEALKGGIISHA